MKFFEWVAQQMGSKARTKKVVDAAGDPSVPGHARSVERDERLMPKPPKKNYWEKRPKVFSGDEAARMFSPSMRTDRASVRTLAPDVELLKERRLPAWKTEAQVAKALELDVKRLRWLANHRYADGVEHYVRYRLPKRSGGFRTIAAPKRTLKAAQRALLAKLTSRLPVSEHAHGFVPGRSVATNARPHVGKRVVMRFDIADFFGSVTFGRVRGYLIAMGYGFEVATSVALLATEAERQPVDLGDRVVYVPIGHRTCVQGAPTSPSICNAVVMRLDRRLAALAAAHGFAYTRYADDMTLSGDDPSKIGLFLRAVGDIVESEGFVLNRKKTKVMRAGRRQQVTGVVVNDVMGLSRTERRKLRAQLHRLGAAAASESSAAERARVDGKLAYLAMINPDQAAALRRPAT